MALEMKMWWVPSKIFSFLPCLYFFWGGRGLTRGGGGNSGNFKCVEWDIVYNIYFNSESNKIIHKLIRPLLLKSYGRFYKYKINNYSLAQVKLIFKARTEELKCGKNFVWHYKKWFDESPKMKLFYRVFRGNF